MDGGINLMPQGGPIAQQGQSQAMPAGAATSSLTTSQYGMTGGGGFHSAMPKVDFFGDLANPYRQQAGRPSGSGGKGQDSSAIPASRMAGISSISPHIDNEQAFSMLNDLGTRVDYGDERKTFSRLNDDGRRLATFNSSEQTGAYPLTNNATRLSQSGPLTNGLTLDI